MADPFPQPHPGRKHRAPPSAEKVQVLGLSLKSVPSASIISIRDVLLWLVFVRTKTGARGDSMGLHLGGAKKKLIETLANSKFELNNWNHRHLTFSNRNKNSLSANAASGWSQNENQRKTTGATPLLQETGGLKNRAVRKVEAKEREILRPRAGSSLKTGQKTKRAGPPLRMTGAGRDARSAMPRKANWPT
jgi:hypothetical protein